LQWISDEFPEEYKPQLHEPAPGRDEIRWVLKDDELTGMPSYRDRSKGPQAV